MVHPVPFLRRAAALLTAVVLIVMAPPVLAARDTLDAVARDYVLLSLTIGEKEEGYIDAYYGPPEIKAQAVADAGDETPQTLQRRAEALRARVQALMPKRRAGVERARARYLEAQLTAAITRLRMMQGEKLPFVEEAKGLFGVTVELPSLASFDPVLARIDKLLPGPGTLADRVDAYNNRFDIPTAKLQPVMEAAIAECRRITLEHIALPTGERFDLRLVTDKPWGGYNFYKGNYHSRIEVNTDLPVRLSRAIDLGCHEGYPGHHVYNLLFEQNLVRGRGWVEYTVYPLYSPQSLIAEGSANYGIDLAFPGDDALTFETRVLAPLAGLNPAEIPRYEELRRLMLSLRLAAATIAQQWLDGTIDEAEALRLEQKYGLGSPERAKKALSFARAYRSYVINYGFGEDIVRAAVEAAGAEPAARWARLKRMLSEPTLPSDLQAEAGQTAK